MSDDARKEPKFPWDYEVPNDAFWNSLEYTLARNFLQCYNESEISKMHFDATLPSPEKLKYLRRYLDNTFEEKDKKAAPVPLHDADYQTWLHLKLAMSTVEFFLENYDDEEVIVREMYENGPDGTKSMSALHQLSAVMEKTRRYTEAEAMAKEVLPWMQGHELLGRDSPQALSGLRILATSVWKQKRYVDGEEWMSRYERTIDDMKNGKFGKYEDAERKLYTDTRQVLDQWRKEHVDA
ncbi:hypothetical protein EG329_002204 [Mollisiaceae sp. DMI_Dod_QoI]|nr:hypothetical protein EG329_002204 [Helotiales sp. DMI_Dod_QoI]